MTSAETTGSEENASTAFSCIVHDGPGIDNALAMTIHTGATAGTYYYLMDHLGSVHALANTNGVIVESYRYDAWGRVLGVYDGNGSPLTESAVGNRILWQGREYSWKTGLYNFRARWYDPIVGRFISKDPIGVSGGLNQYTAFRNSPINYRDPDGLDAYIFVRDGHLGLMIDAGPGKYRSYDFHMRDRGPADAARLLKGTDGQVLSRPMTQDDFNAYLNGPALAVWRVKGTDDSAMIAEALRQVQSPPRYGEEEGVCVQRALQLVQKGNPVVKFPDFADPTRRMWHTSQPLIESIDQYINSTVNKNHVWVERMK